jgi:hypothetical protein
MTMGLALGQVQVNVVQGVAVAGDFCDSNPRHTYLAGPGGLIAAAGGCVVGRFAWATSNPADGDGTPAAVSNAGGGPVSGFVANTQQALNVVYLAGSGMTIPQGFGMELFTAGGFWVVNDGAAPAIPGQKAYANFADGKVGFAATGSPSVKSSATGSIAAGALTITGGVNGNILTVQTLTAGNVYPGATVTGSGILPGTKIVSQITPLKSGEALNGLGRYYVNIFQTVAPGSAITGNYGVFTAASALTGSFGVGQVLTGSGVVAGTTITALQTGTGGLGTYIVDNATVVASTTISGGGNVETKWFCRSSGNIGELVKISSQPQG